MLDMPSDNSDTACLRIHVVWMVHAFFYGALCLVPGCGTTISHALIREELADIIDMPPESQKIKLTEIMEKRMKDQKSRNEALSYYRNAAKEGSLESQVLLYLFDYHGVAVSDNEAVALRKQSVQRLAEAEYQLGLFHQREGRKWFLRASERGHVEAKALISNQPKQKD